MVAKSVIYEEVMDTVFGEAWALVDSNRAYAISTEGRVFSFHSRRCLRPGIASNGYPTVSLGRGNTRTLHSLVARAFIGPQEGQLVRHKDGCRTNPRLDNLEYGSWEDNIADAKKHGTFVRGSEWANKVWSTRRSRGDNGSEAMRKAWTTRRQRAGKEVGHGS